MSSLLRLLRAQLSPPTNPTASFAGKTVLLTGATSGLGFEAALKLLTLNVDTLIITSRTLPRGNATKTLLEERTRRPGAVRVYELEMSSFQSVRDFAARVAKDIPRLDIALLNAGLLHREYTVSPHDWEETLQVNTLSTSLLALLLLPKLRSSSSSLSPSTKTPDSPPHLTVVSSQQFVRVQPQSLRTDGPILPHLNSPHNFAGTKQYGISKLLLEYVLKSVAARVRRDDGSIPVIVNTVSPGFCESGLGRRYDGFLVRWGMWVVYKLFARTAEQGSRSLVSGTYQGVESHGKCWRSDGYLDESMALTVGDEGKYFQSKVWEEVIEVLQAQSDDVRAVIESL